LAHHLDERIIARHEQALLAIGGEAHVLPVERVGGGDRDRLLAGRLHVEAGLPLPLGAVHSVVEDADHRHVTKHPAKAVGVQARVPRAYSMPFFVEDPDQSIGKVAKLACRRRHIRTRDTAGRRNDDMAEIDFVPGTGFRLRHMK
jgi:hypothetical protein